MRFGLVLFTAVTIAGAIGESASAAPALPTSASVSTASAGSCDPCVFIFIERHGNGSVVSNETDNQGLRLDCGTRCNADYVSWETEAITLRGLPESEFRGWEVIGRNGCPAGAANVCKIPLDGDVWCIKAYFGSGTAPHAAGACPPPGTPPPPPAPPTPPPVTGVCSNEGFYTSGPDVIRGNFQNEILCGGGGNDVIYGGGGDDLLRGGPGNDRLYGQGGNDKLYGDAVAPGKPRGKAGNDQLFGGAGADRLFGEGGADLLDGGAAVDRFSGGAGADVLRARDGRREIVDGNRGRDSARVDRRDVARSIERRF